MKKLLFCIIILLSFCAGFFLHRNVFKSYDKQYEIDFSGQELIET